MSVHPSSIISPRARLDQGVEIGPFCVLEGDVSIGAGTVIESHARIGHSTGKVIIGRNNLVQNGAVLGGPPQDIGFAGGDTRLVIGDHNRIGEYVSISQGTLKAAGETVVGHHTLLMAFSHIGHDCTIGDHVIITNGTQLAGHVRVDPHALISGLVGITQFCRIGSYAFLTAGAFANKDIPPFTIAEGHWARPRALNKVALQRAGMDAGTQRAVRRAVRILLDSSLTIDAVCEQISQDCEDSPSIRYLLEFLQTSEKGIARR